MISKIQGYSNSNYTPAFTSAVVSKGTHLVTKRRGQMRVSAYKESFGSRIKNLFFEIFPKLDPEYKSLNMKF
jgi:hypothetical protein